MVNEQIETDRYTITTSNSSLIKNSFTNNKFALIGNVS